MNGGGARTVCRWQGGWGGGARTVCEQGRVRFDARVDLRLGGRQASLTAHHSTESVRSFYRVDGDGGSKDVQAEEDGSGPLLG